METKNGLTQSLSRFDQEADLIHVDGTGNGYLDRQVLEDRGVLGFEIKPAQGWRQGFLILRNLEKCDVPWNLVYGVSFQIKVSETFYEKLGWLNFSCIFQNYKDDLWLEVLGENLRKSMRPNRWNKMVFYFKDKEDRQMTTEIINRISIGFNSEHEVGGYVWLADFDLLKNN